MNNKVNRLVFIFCVLEVCHKIRMWIYSSALTSFSVFLKYDFFVELLELNFIVSDSVFLITHICLKK